MSLRVGWYAVTDSVVISDVSDGAEESDELEVSRADWIEFVAAVQRGELSEPWSSQDE